MSLFVGAMMGHSLYPTTRNVTDTLTALFTSGAFTTSQLMKINMNVMTKRVSICFSNSRMRGYCK